jgi:hypothetical protein
MPVGVVLSKLELTSLDWKIMYSPSPNQWVTNVYHNQSPSKVSLRTLLCAVLSAKY